VSTTLSASPSLWLAPAFVAAAVLTALGTALVRRYSIARSILDVPNHRSSHSIPTPRGGGIAMGAVLLGGILCARAVGVLGANVTAALLGGGAIVAAIGWWDDHAAVPARYRVIAHFAAAVWSVAWLGGFPTLAIGAEAHHLGAVGSVLAVLGTVWCVNFYNFMDGIDGIAATTALVVAAFGTLLLLQAGDVALALVATLVAGTSLGFLAWNWPPARIFMGDVGSGLLGFMFATLALSSERRGGPPLVVWVLLLGVFVVDATVTLGRRVLHGDRWYDAHRSHAYQRAVQVGGSHLVVTAIVAVLDVALGGAALLAASSTSRTVPVITAAAVGLLLVYGAVERATPMYAARRD
jgi:Fuc2NAc and GlcNAc transferase